METEVAEISADVILVVAVVEVLAGVGVLGAEIPARVKCLVPPVATAEKNARFLSNPQMENRFIAVNVLKRWVDEVIADSLLTDQDLMIDHVHPRLKVARIWEQSTQSSTKF